MKKVAVIVGSLRRDSVNLHLAQALAKLAEGQLAFDFVDLSAVPLYNDDLWTDPPAPVLALKQAVADADGVLFVTPEYNRSVPAALKNAIDVGSRPYGKSVWSGKPGAVVSVSPGALGAFGANHHLRQSLVFLDVPTLQQPEAYLGGAANWFDKAGELKDDGVRSFMTKFMEAYAAWVPRFSKPAAA